MSAPRGVELDEYILSVIKHKLIKRATFNDDYITFGVLLGGSLRFQSWLQFACEILFNECGDRSIFKRAFELVPNEVFFTDYISSCTLSA